MAIKTRPGIKREAMTLPPKYYTDPDYFRLEMERVFFDIWLFAGRAEQIPESGSYFVVDLLDESVIVLRDGNDAVRAFHNTCRHRGTRLCKDERGRFAERIQCPYHAWTYDLQGGLAKAPHMDQTEGFSEADYPLVPVSVELWDGHIFINFAERPVPLSEHLAELPEKFRPWRMEELRLGRRIVYDLRANWKLVIQNYSECIHCPIIHPVLNRHSHYLSGENEPPQPAYLGGRMDLRDSAVTLTMDGTTRRSCLPGLGDENKRQVYYYAILPNLLLNLHPDYMLTFALWPRAHDRTVIVCDWHFHPDEMAKPDFDPSDAVEFWDLTNRQDWEVSELAQRGIGSRGYRRGPYSHREELLHSLDQWIIERTGVKP
jgi:Rieske 2Fe-2S family protein